MQETMTDKRWPAGPEETICNEAHITEELTSQASDEEEVWTKCNTYTAPHRYNFCACGLMQCHECSRDPWHYCPKDPGCAICETHHRARCKCGSIEAAKKNALRKKFCDEMGLTAQAKAIETVEEEEKRSKEEAQSSCAATGWDNFLNEAEETEEAKDRRANEGKSCQKLEDVKTQMTPEAEKSQISP